MRDGGEVGAADEVGLETFKKGAVLEEEQQAHALPGAQWAALQDCLAAGASISRTAQVMREICDAVDHEVTKEVCPRHSRCLHACVRLYISSPGEGHQGRAPPALPLPAYMHAFVHVVT